MKESKCNKTKRRTYAISIALIALYGLIQVYNIRFMRSFVEKSGSLSERKPLMESTEKSSRTLVFMFWAGETIYNRHVWEQFFKGVDPSRYWVVVHCAEECMGLDFFNPERMVIAPRAPSAWCFDLVSLQNQLLLVATNLTVLDKDMTSYIMLAQDTIPIKTFDEMARILDAEDGTSWCFWKYSNWAPVGGSIGSSVVDWNTIDPAIPRHAKTHWLIFDYTTAERIVEVWINHPDPLKLNNLHIALPTGLWGCLDEYWHWSAVYGIQHPPTVDLSKPFVEQGSCFTYTAWPSIYEEGSPFLEIDMAKSNMAAKRSNSASFFITLHEDTWRSFRSSHLLFARKFHDLTEFIWRNGTKTKFIHADLWWN